MNNPGPNKQRRQYGMVEHISTDRARGQLGLRAVAETGLLGGRALRVDVAGHCCLDGVCLSV